MQGVLLRELGILQCNRIVNTTKTWPVGGKGRKRKKKKGKEKQKA
jgi:hypothetical protein